MSIGEFIWSLLPRAYKRIKQSVSEIYMLCSAVGEKYEEIMQLIFSIRRAWLIETAPEWALALHGIDRRMPRLPDEPTEVYRQRLLGAYATYALGGTNTGIIEALKALNLEVTIEELYKTDPTKKSEMNIVVSNLTEPISLIKLKSIQLIIKKTKASHAKLASFMVVQTWDEYDAANITWDELDALEITWDEFDLGGWLNA